MLLAEATAMGTFLSTMGEVSTWIFGQITTIGKTIMDQKQRYIVTLMIISSWHLLIKIYR